MKSSKILLILASAALLASCGGGSTSSAAGTSSAGTSSAATTSEASKPADTSNPADTSRPADTSAQPPVVSSEPEPEPSSEPEPEPSSEPIYSSADAKVGKEVLLKSVQKSLSNDAIAINGNAVANGRGHSIVGGSYDGSKETYYEGDILLTAAYNLDAAVSGLQAKNPNDLKIALELNGAHDLQVTMDGASEPLVANTMELDEGAYFVNKVGYFNFSETFATLMAQSTGYPYGAGKVHTPAAEIPDSVFPLLNDEVIGQAVQGFEQILAYGDMLFPGRINYAVAGSEWKVELALDADSILNLVKTLAGDEVGAMYSKMIGLLDIEECALSIDFNDSCLEALHLGINASLDATYGEMNPTGEEPPAEIKDKEFVADVLLQFGFEFSYGEEVALPSDLDTYEEAVYSNPHGGHSDRKYMEADDVLEFIEGYGYNPNYTSVTAINGETGSSDYSVIGDEKWDSYMASPSLTLNDASISALKESGIKYQFWLEGERLVEQVSFDSPAGGMTVNVNATVYFGSENGFRYASYCETHLVASTGQEATQFTTFEWGYDEPVASTVQEPVRTESEPEPEPSSESEIEQSQVVIEATDITLDELKEIAASVEDPGYDKLDLFRVGEEGLEHFMEVDADSSIWSYVQNFQFHLSLQNIKEMEAQLGSSGLLTADFAVADDMIIGTFTFEGSDSKGGFEGKSVITYDLSTLYTLYEATQYDYEDDTNDYVDVVKMEWSFR
ncbi:MAG: hypothetical protein IJS37_05450 [Bacilli bacterium]|nr:hypothetical protein [Bacilli bacterium]